MNSDSHKLTVILITLLYCIRGISKQVKCAEITRFCICAIDKVVITFNFASENWSLK